MLGGSDQCKLMGQGWGVQQSGFLLSKTTSLPAHTSAQPLDDSGGGKVIWAKYREPQDWPQTPGPPPV